MRIKPGRIGQQRTRRLEKRAAIRAEAEKKKAERKELNKTPNYSLCQKISKAFAVNSIAIEDDPSITIIESRGSDVVDFSAITVHGDVVSMLVNAHIDMIQYRMTHGEHPPREWHDKNTSDFFDLMSGIDESQCLEYVDETAKMVGLIGIEVSMTATTNPNGFYRVVSKNNGKALMLVVATGEAVNALEHSLEVIKLHLESESSPCDHCCQRNCEPCSNMQDKD